MSRYVINRKDLDENIEIIKKKAGVPLIGVAYDPKVTAFLDYVEQNNYMQFEALNEKDLSDLIDSAVALAGRGEELRRRTELLNRQEDNNRATAARLLGKE